MMNFWQIISEQSKKEKRPIFCLAPMADVTDRAYRQIITKYGKPDVMWTEFVSADGLVHPIACEKLKIDLMYTEDERPIVAQLFSSNPENMKEAVKYCILLGFDGIDINMGCPDKSIENQGCGSAMIKNPEKACMVIESARAAIRESGKDIPLSVKTRVGYYKSEIDTWIKMLLGLDLDVLTIHARTRKDLSKVPANWDYIKQIVRLRDDMKKKTLIIGNGDIFDIPDAISKWKETNCDGVMIGRAIFGNPWLFSNSQEFENSQIKNKFENFWYHLLQFLGFKNRYWLRIKSRISKKERLKVLFEHAKLFDKLLGKEKSFAIMKKHFKAYVNGFDGAKEIRNKLMETKNFEEFKKVFKIDKIL